jgi:hypothetical protein
LERCFEKTIPRIAHDGNNVLHQATNILRLTLCSRGQCKPTPENTVYVTMFHVKNMPSIRYTQYAFTWKMEQGFPVRSVVGPMELPGHSQQTINFVTTINYLIEESSDSRADHLGADHGYLDSKVILSFGVGDGSGKATFIYASHLIAGENMC